MALSPAEKQKAYRERQKKEQSSSKDAVYRYLKTPFHKYLGEDSDWDSVTMAFESLGFEAPLFQDDRGPEAYALDDPFDSNDHKLEVFEPYPGSIGRADAMVNYLLGAATDLARIIQRFKLQELDARLAEISAKDLSQPEDRKRALKEAVHIERIRDALVKETRWTLPRWETKGLK